MQDEKKSIHGEAYAHHVLRESVTSSVDLLKAESIQNACEDQDIDALIDAAIKHDGFINDDFRRDAWPILLGCDAVPVTTDDTWKTLPVHKDEEQVGLDVHRSFVYYPDDPNAQVDTLKGLLSDLIIATLRIHPSLSYFQGYHDIAQVLLLVLGPALARPALARLSLLRIRDFMLPSLAGAVAQLHLLPAILRVSDPPLAQYLPSNPFWALAATLTLYAHDVQTYAHIARLFDFLLAQPAIATLYLYAAVVRSRREDLLEIDPADQDILHVTLTKLPSHRMDFDELIIDALYLMKTHPPESLRRSWHNISTCSVLRTASDSTSVRSQSLIEGETWLGYQSREAARQARMQALVNTTKLVLWQYRRHALIGVTLTVAMLAVWAGRRPDFSSKSLSPNVLLSNLWNAFRKGN